MAITSENHNRTLFRFRYSKTQVLYASVYVVVTFLFLLFLNIYCSLASQRLFYQAKQVSMLEKARLTASELSDMEVMNTAAAEAVIHSMDSLTVDHLIVTDGSGLPLYSSSIPGYEADEQEIPEEVTLALSGNDVFTWFYQDGYMQSHAAVPFYSRGSLAGCIFLMEMDREQGVLIHSLQQNLLRFSLVMELAVIVFSLIFSSSFSTRLSKIMTSVRGIQAGDYSQKVYVGGRDELTFLGDEINDLTERLQTSEKKRQQFVSDASHELKTPLASIKLLTDSILQNSMDPETTREFVEDIGNEAERLNRMSQKLLTLTRADDVLPEEDAEIIFMAPTITRVVKMLQGIALQNNIAIHTDLSRDSTILIPEDDLYQIAFNLTENGLKYNTPGGTLTICLGISGENATITFTDTGVGIPEESLSHIFERFYRVDKARSRKSGGSGLGLAIVRSIVERNRGEILVESQPGKGSRFTVSFPVFDTFDPDGPDLKGE